MRKYYISIFFLLACSTRNYGNIPNNISVSAASPTKDGWPATIPSGGNTNTNTPVPPVTNPSSINPILPPTTNPSIPPLHPATSTPSVGTTPPSTPPMPSLNAPVSLPNTVPSAPIIPITPVISPATPDVTAAPPAIPPASPSVVVASASSAAYTAPTPLYCTNGQQMGLIAAKINPVSASIPSAPKGIPMLESTAQSPVPQGQSTLSDIKTLCASAGGPDMKKLKQQLEKQKYETSVLKKIK